MMQTRPKILIIRGGALGDVIMTTPIIRELYNDYNGYVDIYVQTGCPDVFKNSPYVAGINPNPHHHYDAVYNLTQSYENNPAVHAVKAYRWSVFGNVEMNNYSLELHPTNADRAKVAALGYKNYIVIHMRQHNWPSRNLRPEFFKSLVEKILAETDLTVVQVGGEHELAFTGNERVISDLGKYSIQELMCLIESSHAFIGVDGGLIHVAACTDTPMLAFFTSCKAEYRKPLRNSKFYPLEANIECYGCQIHNPVPCTEFICHRGDVACIDAFNVDSVVATLKQAVENNE